MAAAAWEVEREPHEIGWAAYVRRGYDEADKSPGILVDVSNRYARARAMLLALKPPEPGFDEDIALAVSCDVKGGDPPTLADFSIAAGAAALLPKTGHPDAGDVLADLARDWRLQIEGILS